MKTNKGQFKKGYKVSKEVIQKRVKSRSGYSHSEETKMKIGLSNKGKTHTEEQNKKHSKQMIGVLSNEKNPMWKGDNANKGSIHNWIEGKRGFPNYCEHCKKINKKKYEWANKDHTYKRKIEDYIRLCTSCHRKYDIKNNGYTRNINILGQFTK